MVDAAWAVAPEKARPPAARTLTAAAAISDSRRGPRTRVTMRASPLPGTVAGRGGAWAFVGRSTLRSEAVQQHPTNRTNPLADVWARYGQYQWLMHWVGLLPCRAGNSGRGLARPPPTAPHLTGHGVRAQSHRSSTS